ncbi:hypothetical protein V5799_014404 [Amblyomma americanum]|uniref:Uncharacterized protein n=1 Tax=Amblyomma americanum TaxID=6943 RepID=A0AAQ4E358_AMBAM
MRTMGQRKWTTQQQKQTAKIRDAERSQELWLHKRSKARQQETSYWWCLQGNGECLKPTCTFSEGDGQCGPSCRCCGPSCPCDRGACTSLRNR